MGIRDCMHFDFVPHKVICDKVLSLSVWGSASFSCSEIVTTGSNQRIHKAWKAAHAKLWLKVQWAQLSLAGLPVLQGTWHTNKIAHKSKSMKTRLTPRCTQINCPSQELTKLLFPFLKYMQRMSKANKKVKCDFKRVRGCGLHKTEWLRSWRSLTHLFPVVENDDFTVLVVNRHRALVAFTCRDIPHVHTEWHHKLIATCQCTLAYIPLQNVKMCGLRYQS